MAGGVGVAADDQRARQGVSVFGQHLVADAIADVVKGRDALFPDKLPGLFVALCVGFVGSRDDMIEDTVVQAKAEYAQRRAQSQSRLDAQQQAEIRRIATDFPSLWAHPATSMQDKKRMVRLLIEDVTLPRHQYQLDLFIRCKAGALIQRTVRLARGGPVPTVIDPAIIDQIDTLSNAYTAGEIAAKLNQAGVPHPNRGDFDTMAVVYLLKRFKLPSRYQRLRSKGYVTQEEIAQALGVHVETVQRWRKKGWIQAHYYNLVSRKFPDA